MTTKSGRDARIVSLGTLLAALVLTLVGLVQATPAWAINTLGEGWQLPFIAPSQDLWGATYAIKITQAPGTGGHTNSSQRWAIDFTPYYPPGVPWDRIDPKRGYPVYSVADGQVSYVHPCAAQGQACNADQTGGSGYMVAVQYPHSDGTMITVRYLHLNPAPEFRLVTVGQWVAWYDKIGQAACTGLCTGVHVHMDAKSGMPYGAQNGGTAVPTMDFRGLSWLDCYGPPPTKSSNLAAFDFCGETHGYAVWPPPIASAAPDALSNPPEAGDELQSWGYSTLVGAGTGTARMTRAPSKQDINRWTYWYDWDTGTTPFYNANDDLSTITVQLRWGCAPAPNEFKRWHIFLNSNHDLATGAYDLNQVNILPKDCPPWGTTAPYGVPPLTASIPSAPTPSGLSADVALEYADTRFQQFLVQFFDSSNPQLGAQAFYLGPAQAQYVPSGATVSWMVCGIKVPSGQYGCSDWLWVG